MCGVLGGVLFVLVSIVVLLAPVVAMVFAPGFINQPEKMSLTVDMLRITFPYLLLISMTGFAGAILNSYDRFVVPAFTPVLLNLSLIGFALWVSPLMAQPVFALAWAVFFAGCAQLLFQLPFLQRLQLMPVPTWKPQHEGVRKIIALMLPAIFGVSVSQINLLLDTVLASFLPTGSVSWLYYSDRLAELPLGVFAIAIATVILPSLSRMPKDEDLSLFRQTLDWALRSVIVIAIPAAVALIVLAEPILFTLFQYQAMTVNDVAMSAYSLRAYALGLLAFMAIKVLATGYYSRQDMKTPVRIGIIALVANMIFNLIFVSIFHFAWQIGHMGLALATAASAFLNAGLLLKGLLPLNADARPESDAIILSSAFWRLLFKVSLAVVLMSVFLIWAMPEAAIWAAADWLTRLSKLAVLCVLGLSIYLLSLFALGVRINHFKAQAFHGS